MAGEEEKQNDGFLSVFLVFTRPNWEKDFVGDIFGVILK